MRLLPLLFLLLINPVFGENGSSTLKTVQVAYKSIPQERHFDATIEAIHQATISAQTRGRIEEIHFDVDDFVPKGTVILRFRDTEQKARLKAAQASLKEAKARLAQAEQEFERIQVIYQKKLVAKSALDKAAAELKAAQARHTASMSRVEEASEQLQYTVVKAPYSGIVTKRHVEVGESANIGQPLMTGLSLDKLRAVANIPQSFIENIRTHNQARIIHPMQSGGEFITENITIFPYADPDTHTFKVRVDLPQGISGLYPGMLVKIAFKMGETRRLLVPFASVVFRSEVTAVYVVDKNGYPGLRQVRAGNRYNNDLIEIHAGLRDGESIAVDPVRAGIVLKQLQASKVH